MLFPFLKSYSSNVVEQAIYDRPKRKRTEYLKFLSMVFPTSLSCVIPLFMLLLCILWPFCYYIPFIFSHFHQIKPLCRNNQAASKKSAPCPLIPFALSSTTDNRSSTISHFPFSFTLPLPPTTPKQTQQQPQHSPPLPPILSKRACCGIIIEVKDS